MALVAVFAFSAMAAQGASAQDVLTTETENPVNLQGTQEGDGSENFFTTTWNEEVDVSCPHAEYEGTGTVADGATEFEVHPIYPEEGCKALGGHATIHTDGCDFILTGETHETEDATVSLKCDEGKDIIVTGPFGSAITIQAANNQELSGVSYTNIGGSPDEVTVKVTVHGIEYHANFACQLAGITKTDNDGFLEGAAIVKGFDGAEHDNQVGITVS